MHPVNRIDRFVGDKIRLRRTQLGIARQDLAAALKVSECAMQDYEEGRARMDAPLVFRICRLLDIRSKTLFDGLVPQLRGQSQDKKLAEMLSSITSTGAPT